MKLRIKGDYVKDGFLKFEPCEIIIEFGKIQRIKFNNRQLFVGHQPSYNSEFRIEKIFYEQYSKRLKYTYRLLYHNEKKDTKAINIKPNSFQVFRIKWAFDQYLILSNEVKVGVLKSILIGLLGFIGGVVFENAMSDKGFTKEIENSENQISNEKIYNLDSITDQPNKEFRKDTLNKFTEKPNAQQSK